jgi:hypothetical protein
MKSRENQVREETKMEGHASGHEPDGEEFVSETDVDGWAARERARRRAWLEGPSEEEKTAWAKRERHRRARQTERGDYEDDEVEGRRMAERWRREAELVLTGLASRILETPYALLGTVSREGRRHEDEFKNIRRRRKRVLPDDDI